MTLETLHGTFRNDWHFARYKNVPLAEPAVRWRVLGREGDDSSVVHIELSTDKPAFFVWMNAKGIGGEFSDNCMTLVPGRTVDIEFAPKAPVKTDVFSKSLSVVDLSKTLYIQ